MRGNIQILPNRTSLAVTYIVRHILAIDSTVNHVLFDVPGIKSTILFFLAMRCAIIRDCTLL